MIIPSNKEREPPKRVKRNSPMSLKYYLCTIFFYTWHSLQKDINNDHILKDWGPGNWRSSLCQIHFNDIWIQLLGFYIFNEFWNFFLTLILFSVYVCKCYEHQFANYFLIMIWNKVLFKFCCIRCIHNCLLKTYFRINVVLWRK